jgi:hypothetical protein
MPINPTPTFDWTKTVKVTAVAVLATMAFGAIVLPVLGVVAGMAAVG